MVNRWSSLRELAEELFSTCLVQEMVQMPPVQEIEEVPQIPFGTLEKIAWSDMVSMQRSSVIVIKVRSFVVVVSFLPSKPMLVNYRARLVLFPVA